jgi:dTDP-4-dehydrorhamnose 3,5-epimerase-like enzyme
VNPSIINGNHFQDHRGTLRYNNDFDASSIKRIYIIENKDLSIERAWQGHRIEQRWFSAIKGSFLIKLIQIDNWENPNPESTILEFEINDQNLEILHIPSGYVSSIKANTDEARLLVMADYLLGEIKDEYRFPLDYFK